MQVAQIRSNPYLCQPAEGGKMRQIYGNPAQENGWLTMNRRKPGEMVNK